MKKKALIIGLSSQDGSYLADFLLEKDYEVIGTIRRNTNPHKENINHLIGKVKIEAADLIDSESLVHVIKKYKPDEIYNIAAQSVPADSWSHPMYTGEVTALGPVRVLEALRHHSPESKFYQATSREIYGNVDAVYATERTPFDANNPYGIAKSYAHMMVRNYRESYNLFACSGILFNHESPRRSLHFVTRKVTAAVACIKNQAKNPPVDETGAALVRDDKTVHLGFLEARRDWGYAKEYVEAMWLMLQRDTPKDYVIASKTSYSVKDLCEIAFSYVGLDWAEFVKTDCELMRPTEIKELCGDYSLAKQELGWEPRTTFPNLIAMMVEADLQKFK